MTGHSFCHKAFATGPQGTESGQRVILRVTPLAAPPQVSQHSHQRVPLFWAVNTEQAPRVTHTGRAHRCPCTRTRAGLGRVGQGWPVGQRRSPRHGRELCGHPRPGVCTRALARAVSGRAGLGRGLRVCKARRLALGSVHKAFANLRLKNRRFQKGSCRPAGWGCSRRLLGCRRGGQQRWARALPGCTLRAASTSCPAGPRGQRPRPGAPAKCSLWGRRCPHTCGHARARGW